MKVVPATLRNIRDIRNRRVQGPVDHRMTATNAEFGRKCLGKLMYRAIFRSPACMALSIPVFTVAFDHRILVHVDDVLLVDRLLGGGTVSLVESNPLVGDTLAFVHDDDHGADALYSITNTQAWSY